MSRTRFGGCGGPGAAHDARDRRTGDADRPRALSGRPLAEARTLYRQVLAVVPNHADVHCNLGVVLQETGQLEEAIAALSPGDRAQDPAWPRPTTTSAPLCPEGPARRGDRRTSATRSQLKPDHAAAHNNLGGALQEAGRLDEAIAAYRRAIALEPDSAGAHSNLGSALTGTGRPDEAVATSAARSSSSPRMAEAHNNLGCRPACDRAGSTRPSPPIAGPSSSRPTPP